MKRNVRYRCHLIFSLPNLIHVQHARYAHAKHTIDELLSQYGIYRMILFSNSLRVVVKSAKHAGFAWMIYDMPQSEKKTNSQATPTIHCTSNITHPTLKALSTPST
ncbi:hypothetical protein K443DRAFT_225651 [Laccaria amethystina LaAM-08-1]|uniref:Uncharacterized protein n=1 Tax=Laccaria amethystina LaAM-08-1 TaxID=1095629 RepID=A0A0C9XPI5_9AGAR|nr:hypothetical protein K443DRAFT_225651 [Laccaria amethystina LaAM-08-1]